MSYKRETGELYNPNERSSIYVEGSQVFEVVDGKIIRELPHFPIRILESSE